jgi:hypothetical protein
MAAESTWKTYKTAVESLSKFRTLYGFSENWPVSIDVLLHYIAYLSASAMLFIFPGICSALT